MKKNLFLCTISLLTVSAHAALLKCNVTVDSLVDRDGEIVPLSQQYMSSYKTRKPTLENRLSLKEIETLKLQPLSEGGVNLVTADGVLVDQHFPKLNIETLTLENPLDFSYGFSEAVYPHEGLMAGNYIALKLEYVTKTSKLFTVALYEEGKVVMSAHGKFKNEDTAITLQASSSDYAELKMQVPPLGDGDIWKLLPLEKSYSFAVNCSALDNL